MAEKDHESQKVTSKKNTRTGIAIKKILTGFPNGRKRLWIVKSDFKKNKGQE